MAQIARRTFRDFSAPNDDGSGHRCSEVPKERSSPAREVTLAVACLLLFSAGAAVAAPQSKQLVRSNEFREEDLRGAVARVRSVEVGTAFAILTTGQRGYFVTAAHVVGGRQPIQPPCTLDFGLVEQASACDVLYVFDQIDLAIVSATIVRPSHPLTALRLGDSWHLSPPSRVFTLGYPSGAELRRNEGTVSGADQNRILLNGFSFQPGQSGSPLFDSGDGKVVGVLLFRLREQNEQAALEIDQVKLFLRRELLFRAYVQLTRPPADATGPLVESDRGPTLRNAFASAASPQRWYERAKRYTRTDTDAAVIPTDRPWLGVERTYLSSRTDTVGTFGRGWMHSFEYSVDLAHSTLCRLYLWDSRGVRLALDTVIPCDEAKRNLHADVADESELDLPLKDLLRNDRLAAVALPEHGPSYVGADLQVARVRFIARGLEVTVGDVKYAFDERGRIKQIRPGESDAIDIEYDAKSRLHVVSDGKAALEFVFDDRDRVIKATISDGSQYEYMYDASDNLTEVSLCGDPIWKYSYDNRGRLVELISLKRPGLNRQITYTGDGLRRSVVTPDTEYRWEFKEDPNGLPIVKQTFLTGQKVTGEREYQFDYQDNRLTMKDGDDTTVYHLTQCLCLPLDVTREAGTAVYRYDPFGRLIGGALAGREVRLTYDDDVNKVKKREIRSDNGWEVDNEFTYDGRGNLISARGHGRSLNLSYNGDRIARIVDKVGHREVRIEYARFGKPALIEVPGVGRITVTYKESGEIDKVESGTSSTVAVQVASIFNTLLDLIGDEHGGIEIDQRFSLIDCEPGEVKGR